MDFTLGYAQAAQTADNRCFYLRLNILPIMKRKRNYCVLFKDHLLCLGAGTTRVSQCLCDDSSSHRADISKSNPSHSHTVTNHVCSTASMFAPHIETISPRNNITYHTATPNHTATHIILRPQSYCCFNHTVALIIMGLNQTATQNHTAALIILLAQIILRLQL